MGGIVLCLNEVGAPLNGNDVRCPYCGSSTIRRWGSGQRSVHDTKTIQAVIHRFFCVDCGRTFRYYPQGVDRAQLSRRMRRLAAVLWLMEVSTREVEDIFASLGVSINRMTVWREGQKLLEELSHQKLLSPENRFAINRVNGTNGNGSLSRSNKANGGGIPPSLSICVDSGTIALVGKLNIYDEKRVERWLRLVLADQAIEILSLSDFDFSSAKLLSIPL